MNETATGLTAKETQTARPGIDLLTGPIIASDPISTLGSAC
jgi:hypothetical protein